MPDNKDVRSQPDRSRVAAEEEYELNYITEKMGVTKEEVRNAIAQVGNSREKIEEYLRGRTKK